MSPFQPRAWYRNWLDELRTLLQAGFPIVTALGTLAREKRGPGAELAARAEGRVKAGATLAESLAAETSVPEEDAALIEAGETAGALPRVLASIVERLDRRSQFRAETAARLAYPLLTAAAAAVLLPVPLLVQGRVALYLAIQLCVWLPVSALVLAARKGVWLPWVSTLLRELAIGRSLDLLGLLLQCGIPIGRALPLAARATRRDEIAQTLQAAERSLREGQTLRDALARTSLFEGQSEWLTRVAVGEQSGNMDTAFCGLGAEIERKVWRRALTGARLLPFVITPLVGLAVLIYALRVFSAIYGDL